MSAKVHPIIAMDPTHMKPEDVRVLHFVPHGEKACACCGLSKLRMGFHYTDEPAFWLHVTQTIETNGAMYSMWSDSHSAALPYFICGFEEEGRAEFAQLQMDAAARNLAQACNELGAALGDGERKH